MGSDKLKKDEEYGYTVSLNEGRPLPEGHDIFNFGATKNEVAALSKIFNKYMNTTTLESTCKIPEYKIDFSLNFLDAMILIVTKKMEQTMQYLDDIETQLNDISHRIIKPSLSGRVMSKDDKLKIYDMQEELLMRRRNIKDALSMQKVFIENMERTRNFNLAMNQRMYSPKSERFQGDPGFYIDKKINKETRVNTEVS